MAKTWSRAGTVVANAGSNSVSILLGNPFTIFWPAIHFDVGLSPRFVAVGDFDGDGVLDLAVANQNSNNVSVLLGNGDRTFQAAVNYATGSGPSHVAVADFDGDGIPDLAVANQTSNQGNVMPGHGDGTFETLAYLDRTGTRPVHMAVGDFDGDGKPDLAVANAGSNNVSVLVGNWEGTFRPAQNFPLANSPRSLVTGDFNRVLLIFKAPRPWREVSINRGWVSEGGVAPFPAARGKSPVRGLSPRKAAGSPRRVSRTLGGILLPDPNTMRFDQE